MKTYKKLAGTFLSAALLLSGSPIQASGMNQRLQAPVLYAQNTGHSVAVRFCVLYLDSSLSTGYSYGASESTTFICQYNVNHSDTAYNNHTIAISDIKAAANRLSVKDGYKITGWTKTASRNPSINPFTGDPTACNKSQTIYLVAGSTAPATTDYSLIYNANGGSNAPASQTAKDSAASHTFSVASGVPTRADYQFLGWSDTSSGAVKYQAGSQITLQKSAPSKTIYAVWQKNPETKQITLTYDANGGTGAPASETQTVNVGEQAHFVVSSVKPEREGYEFLGWNVNPKGTRADWVAGDTMNTVESVTLYAVWQAKPEPVEKFTVTYTDGVEGEEIFADRVFADLEKGTKTPEFGADPVREGYIFKGWTPEVAETVTGNVTYTAVWEEKKQEPPVGPVDPVDPTDPKESKPSMNKIVVDENGNKIDLPSAKPGETVKFVLNSSVPGNLYDYVTFEQAGENAPVVMVGDYLLTMHDDMDETFALNEDSIVVKIDGRTLAAGDYTFAKTPADCAKEDHLCDFHVSLDLVALYNKGVLTQDDVAKAARITVEYSATLSEEAGVQAHKNHAWTTSKEPDVLLDFVEVDVYGIKVVKQDSVDETKKLAGAEFTLYEQDKETVVGSAVTNENGEISFNGLKAGTYYLLETKAPNGYIRSTDYIEIVVDDEKAANENYVIRPVANTTAPHTGGSGTMLFTCGGAALLGAAVMISVSKRKNKED